MCVKFDDLLKWCMNLLDEGVDVNNIDLDGRIALNIAACMGNIGVVKPLLCRKANMDTYD